MLELIVKEYVPFVGKYNKTYDEKGRILIPDVLLDTLKERQKIQEKRKVKIFYRVYKDSVPPYLELTDYFPLDKEVDFSLYRRAIFYTKSRISVPPVVLREVGIGNNGGIIIKGLGNEIKIYGAEII
mgnify:CR=1 FL=1